MITGELISKTPIVDKRIKMNMVDNKTNKHNDYVFLIVMGKTRMI